MKTVILDGYSANPGDLRWDFLSKYGEYKSYDWTKPEELIPRALGYDVIICNKMAFDRETLKTLADGGLKLITVLATGYDKIDVKPAKELGVTVSNVPAYSTYMVAQHVFALLLEIFDKTALHADAVRAGEWSKTESFSLYKGTINELCGKTMGIIGYGRIGRRVARIAEAFGMNTVAYTRSPVTDGSIKQTDLETLLRESDVVTLHCPLTDKTRGLIGREQFAIMKNTAVLINASRGPVVKENELIEALEKGEIAAAGLDVIDTEPPKEDCRIVCAKNTVITPHIAWAGYETRDRLLRVTEENIRRFLEGEPQNVVSK